tara:strand:- start:1576 stop:2004 length:429 start_codon:yes stop_codon:yes gene_type:complete
MLVLLICFVVFAFPISVGAYHTADHFCTQCVEESCGGGSASDRDYLFCVSSACGAECEVWAADRFGVTDGCVAQCDVMMETCQMASDDSGGLIDDYCADTARTCYAACESEVGEQLADEDMYLDEVLSDVLDEEWYEELDVE